MKLTREVAREQAARLQASVMLAPQSDVGRSEIVECLLRNCSDREHAEQTMTLVLDNARDIRNLPAEIASIAQRTRNPGQPPPGCEQCTLGEDRETGARKWLPYVSRDYKGYAFAGRCTCDRGKWLATQDALRESGASEPPRRGTMAPADYQLTAAGRDSAYSDADGE